MYNLPVKSWQANIHDMLRRVPSVSAWHMSFYFQDIDHKLDEYEVLTDAAMSLELAIWKSKINQPKMNNNDLPFTDMKMQCRTDSFSMVTIIVPNVLP